MTGSKAVFLRMVPLARLVPLLLLLVSSVASAGDRVVLEVVGESRGSGDKARTRAIDRAFATAVRKATGQILAPDIVRERKAEIEADVIRHARRYVTSFQVLNESSVEGVTRVQVAATVDRALLREAFSELDIPLAAGAGAARPSAVLLLKYTTPQKTVTTFGSSATPGGAAGAAMAEALGEFGFKLVPATGSAPVTQEGTTTELPVGDEAAIAMAREAGAGAAFVVGVAVDSDGLVRGTSLRGARGRGVMRVVDVANGAVVAQAIVGGAGFGDNDGAASAAAALEMARRAVRAVSEDLNRYWPTATKSADELLVEVKGAANWSAVAAIISALSATKGVDGINPKADQGRVILGLVTSLSASQVSRSVREARLPNGKLSARVEGDRVVVTVRGQRPFRYQGGESEEGWSDGD